MFLQFKNGPEDGLCRPKHVAPLNLIILNKLDVLDVKCLSFNIELQHIGMSPIKFLRKIFVTYFQTLLQKHAHQEAWK